MDEARRFNVLSIGRRAGKTELGMILCARPETLRNPVGWFAPNYKDMIEVWRSISQRFAPIVARQSGSERRLEFVTGGVLEFWSLDNPQAGRGRKYKQVIVDEAAFVPTLYDSWSYAIRPTLADMEGSAWFLSTPKGRNGFWKLWQYGNDEHEPDWASWQMPSEVNRLIPRGELDAMRRQLPERVAMQELDAMFLEDAGGVFRNVMACATAEAHGQAIPGHEYIFGVDWAMSKDFTVFTVFDVAERALVWVDRFNQIDYPMQAARLKALAQRFKPSQIVAESNAMGLPIIQQLANDGLPMATFNTTSGTKDAAIRDLALAFEKGDIRIIPDPALINELQSYEVLRVGQNGVPVYGAPEGMHDDMVMSAAIGWTRLASAWLAW
jgi:hypothetical protein